MNDGLHLDLHVHSRHSPDSLLTLTEIVERLGERGLQGFALTDHNSVAGHAELAELARRHPRLVLVPGVEVSTADGHLLVYGLSEVPPLHRPVGETVAWVRERGGVPVPAHPTRLVHGIGRRLAATVPVPALEAVNGHTAEIGNVRIELLAARRGIGTTGGSDVHDLRDLGRCFTEFPESVTTVGEVLDALRAGRCEAHGKSLTRAERVRLALHHVVARVGRGFRAI